MYNSANEWREALQAEVMDDYLHLAEMRHFAKDPVAHMEEMREHWHKLQDFIQNLLDQHSAHLVERTQGLEKVLKEIRNIEDLRMKEAQKKNELYDASVRQWATVGLRILDDQAIDIVSGK